jgi:uncharacterized repeat protein (TIGR03803 family)
LHYFENISTNGTNTYSNLIFNLQKTIIYGTTMTGGTNNRGTLFSFNLLTQLLTILHSFNYSDGIYPYAGVILNREQTILYGTTYQSGQYDAGTVYSFDLQTSHYTVLYSFSPNTEGGNSRSELIFNSDYSVLYGTTYRFGVFNSGTLFSVKVNGSDFSILYSFNNANSNAPLILSNNGLSLYGTTMTGGDFGFGSLFVYNISLQNLSILHSFSSLNEEGYSPLSGVVTSSNNHFLYGNTSAGGEFNNGIIYSFDTIKNEYSTLHSFQTLEGTSPYAEMILFDNTLFGCNPYGGELNGGTLFLFRLTDNHYQTLISFDELSGNNPFSSIVLGADGSIYGTTYFGGSFGYGTLFRFSFSPACFNKDSYILVWCFSEKKDKYIHIQNINKKTWVKTYPTGYQQVLFCEKGYLIYSPKYSSCCCWSKKMYQHQKTGLIVTGSHSILKDVLSPLEKYIYKNKIGFWDFKNNQPKKLNNKYLSLSAFSDDFLCLKEEKVYTYYHFTLKNENKNFGYGIWANGILTETPSINEYVRLKKKGAFLSK